MIAKRSNRRSDGRSSFKQLAQYIGDSQNDGEKLIYSHFSNCLAEDGDTEMAIKEIEATQALNTRSKTDKTYHLIASFHEGDQPSREQLDDIEQTLCDALGMGDHQRLAAVHDNTDHLHIHIAINKVHPESLKVVTPYRDFQLLQAACRELEQRHGLIVDNGDPEAERVSARAQDFEAQQGQESFQSWAKGEPRQRLDALMERPEPTWEQLHQALDEYGLEIAPRGAGMVIRDKSDHSLSIRASDLGRSFSKGELEKRLGEYQTLTSNQEAKPSKSRYEPKPFAKTPGNALWKEYKDGQATVAADRKRELKKLSEDLAKAYGSLRREYQGKRLKLKKRKDLKGGKKRAEYSVLRMEHLARQEDIKNKFAALRDKARSDHGSQSWPDFLRSKAADGNTDALAALRRVKNCADQPGASYLETTGKSEPMLFPTFRYKVSRNGDVTYFLGKHQVIDEGKRIRLGENFDDKTVEAALRMARNQFGKTLRLNGSEEFQRQAAAVAGRLKMDVTFTNPELEAEKLSHVKTSNWTDPVESFIGSRNTTGEKVSDILPHRRYNPDSDAGDAVYKGLRSTKGGPMVALFEKDGEYLVKPVDSKTAQALRKTRVGSRINTVNHSTKSQEL